MSESNQQPVTLSLKSRAIVLLNQQKNRKQLSKDTGLSYPWLCKLAKNEIPDPGVLKIEKLIAYCEKPADEEAKE